MNTKTPSAHVTTKPSVIAGQYGGKPVFCEPHVLEDFQRLLGAARHGNHWARVAMKEVCSLTTGHCGKKNIYINESHPLKNGLMELTVYLPGLVAQVQPKSTGSYLITSLELDNHYLEAVSESSHPGLYRAEHSDRWKTSHVRDGSIKNVEGRTVAISNSGHRTPDRAAEVATECVTVEPGMPDKSRLQNKGFDLHFSPGKKRLGGYLRYDALSATKDYNSAVMLADTMQRAKGTEEVYWISEFGGSAVLTQAMQILANRKVTLEKHKAYLFRPSTSPRKAIKLAHQLKMTLNESFSKTGSFDIVGNTDLFLASKSRVVAETDLYDKNSQRKEYRTALMKVAAATGTTLTIGSAFPMISMAIGAGVIGSVGLTTTVLTTSNAVLDDFSQKFLPGKKNSIKKV